MSGVAMRDDDEDDEEFDLARLLEIIENDKYADMALFRVDPYYEIALFNVHVANQLDEFVKSALKRYRVTWNPGTHPYFISIIFKEVLIFRGFLESVKFVEGEDPDCDHENEGQNFYDEAVHAARFFQHVHTKRWKIKDNGLFQTTMLAEYIQPLILKDRLPICPELAAMFIQMIDFDMIDLAEKIAEHSQVHNHDERYSMLRRLNKKDWVTKTVMRTLDFKNRAYPPMFTGPVPIKTQADEMSCRFVKAMVLAGHKSMYWEAMLSMVHFSGFQKLLEYLFEQKEAQTGGSYTLEDLKKGPIPVFNSIATGDSKLLEFLINQRYAVNRTEQLHISKSGDPHTHWKAMMPGSLFYPYQYFNDCFKNKFQPRHLIGSLHLFCVCNGREADLRMLSNAGADWTLRDHKERLPLHHIARKVNSMNPERNWDWCSKFVEDNETLLRRASRDYEDMYGNTPAHYAACQITVKMYNAILLIDPMETANNDGYTPFQLQVYWAKDRRLSRLASPLTGMIANESSTPGKILLHASAAGCNTVTTKELLGAFTSEELLDHENEKARYIEKKDEEGRTAFFIACCSGRRKNLLRYMRLLKEEGANVRTKDNYNNNLMHAVAMGNTEKLAEVNMKNLRGEPGGGFCKLSLHQLYLWCPQMLEEKNIYGDTPLRVALMNRNEFVVAAILSIAGRYKTGYIRGPDVTLDKIPDVPGYNSILDDPSENCDPDLVSFLLRQDSKDKPLLTLVLYELVTPFYDDKLVARIVAMLSMLLAVGAHVYEKSLRAIQLLHVMERRIDDNVGKSQESMLTYDVFELALRRCQKAYKTRESLLLEYAKVKSGKVEGVNDTDNDGASSDLTKKRRVEDGKEADDDEEVVELTKRMTGMHDSWNSYKKSEDEEGQDEEGTDEEDEDNEGSGDKKTKKLPNQFGKFLVYRDIDPDLWNSLTRDGGETTFIVSELDRSRSHFSSADDDIDEAEESNDDTDCWVAEESDILQMHPAI